MTSNIYIYIYIYILYDVKYIYIYISRDVVKALRSVTKYELNIPISTPIERSDNLLPRIVNG